MSKNNKGAALVNVMLISAFVMIMATTIISIAFSNYRMKMINLNAKNNFYSCEAMLDELRVEFRNSLSKSVAKSDVDKLSKLFDNFDLEDVKYVSGTPKQENDPTLYDVKKIASLISIIDNTTVDSTRWKPVVINGVSYLHAYEATVNSVHVVVSATADYKNTDDEIVTWYSKKIIDKSKSQYNLEVTSEHMLLKNITVTYEKNGYSNSISTDIDLKFLGEGSSQFTLDTYSLISFGGFYVAGEHTASSYGTLVVEGNMYLENGSGSTRALIVDDHPQGNQYSFVCTGEHIVINGDLEIKNGAKVVFPNAIDIYINGNLIFDDDTESKLYIGQNTNIYLTNLANKKSKIKTSNIRVLTGDFSKTDDTRAFSMENDGFQNASYVKDYDLEDILIADGTYNYNGMECKIGTSQRDVIEHATMKNVPTGNNGNYADITFQVTVKNDYCLNKSKTDDKAACMMFLSDGAYNNATQYSYDITALIISNGLYSIKAGKSSTYKINNTDYGCIYLRALGDRYDDVLQTEMKANGSIKYIKSNGQENTTGYIEYPFSSLFTKKEMTIGATNEASSSSAKSEKKTLSISYSNWTRE